MIRLNIYPISGKLLTVNLLKFYKVYLSNYFETIDININLISETAWFYCVSNLFLGKRIDKILRKLFEATDFYLWAYHVGISMKGNGVDLFMLNKSGDV